MVMPKLWGMTTLLVSWVWRDFYTRQRCCLSTVRRKVETSFVPNRVNSSESISAQLVNSLVLILRHVSNSSHSIHEWWEWRFGQDVTSQLHWQICWRSPEWHSSFPMKEATTSSTRWWPITNLSWLVNRQSSYTLLNFLMILWYNNQLSTHFLNLQKCHSSQPTPMTSPCAAWVRSLWPALMTKLSWKLLM